jgi:hypothetical protein
LDGWIYWHSKISSYSVSWWLILWVETCHEIHNTKHILLYDFLFFFYIVSGVRLSPLGTAATTGLLYQPQMIDDGDCLEIGGMKIGRGNRSTRRKPAPAPLCPPQIPHDQTRARTRAAAMGSQRLAAWAMARPLVWSSYCRLPHWWLQTFKHAKFP